MECVDYGKVGGDRGLEEVGGPKTSFPRKPSKTKTPLTAPVFAGRILGNAVPAMGNCYVKLLRSDYTTPKSQH